MRWAVEIPTEWGRAHGERATLAVKCDCGKIYDWIITPIHTAREMAHMVADSCAENEHEGLCL